MFKKINLEILQKLQKHAENVKKMLKHMLNHASYTDRSFTALKNPIGGYSDDEIRKMLHELNAKKVNRGDNEWWYLMSRGEERKNKRIAKQNK